MGQGTIGLLATAMVSNTLERESVGRSTTSDNLRTTVQQLYQFTKDFPINMISPLYNSMYTIICLKRCSKMFDKVIFANNIFYCSNFMLLICVGSNLKYNKFYTTGINWLGTFSKT